MNDYSCFLPCNILGDDLMGYISHPNVISELMIGFKPYHAKWGDVLYNTLWILHTWTSADVFAEQHHFFECGLLSRKPDHTMLCMLLLCLLFLPLSHDASLPVVSTDILNSYTSKLVKSIEFSKSLSSSTLIRLHGWC